MGRVGGSLLASEVSPLTHRTDNTGEPATGTPGPANVVLKLAARHDVHVVAGRMGDIYPGAAGPCSWRQGAATSKLIAPKHMTPMLSARSAFVSNVVVSRKRAWRLPYVPSKCPGALGRALQRVQERVHFLHGVKCTTPTHSPARGSYSQHRRHAGNACARLQQMSSLRGRGVLTVSCAAAYGSRSLRGGS